MLSEAKHLLANKQTLRSLESALLG